MKHPDSDTDEEEGGRLLIAEDDLSGGDLPDVCTSPTQNHPAMPSDNHSDTCQSPRGEGDISRTRQWLPFWC